MRAQRQQINLLQQGGANEDDIILARGRYRATSSEYTRFSKAMKLPQQRERVTVDGLGNVGVGKYTKNVSGSVEKSSKNGIIESNKGETAGNNVHILGTIDMNIYRCVTQDIQTDEVIITDRQIEHIKERHPNDYERYFVYFQEIIHNPDYILEANRPNTAFVLKHIVDNGKNYQLILRLKTSTDPKEYKNSVITFFA